MCLPHPTSPGESISLNFAPLAVKVSLLPSTSATPSEVSAYTADSTELTQADVDAAAASLERHYNELPERERRVLAQIILQAGRAVA